MCVCVSLSLSSVSPLSPPSLCLKKQSIKETVTSMSVNLFVCLSVCQFGLSHWHAMPISCHSFSAINSSDWRSGLKENVFRYPPLPETSEPGAWACGRACECVTTKRVESKRKGHWHKREGKLTAIDTVRSSVLPLEPRHRLVELKG